jgi:hypothetical protein
VVGSLTFGWVGFCEKEPSPKMAKQTPHVPKALGCVSLLQHAASLAHCSSQISFPKFSPS